MALAIDFYYGLGSRYAYLASTQLKRIAGETGCRFAWHPVARGALMRLRGGQPFRGESRSRANTSDPTASTTPRPGPSPSPI